MNEEQWMRDQIRRDDEAKFDQRAARALRTKTHKIIPHRWFDVASSECRDMFRDGHFNGCVSLVQAVAEGLLKFLNQFHPVRGKKGPGVLPGRFRKAGVISDGCEQAFTRIRGADRNTFHHLNEDIITDVAKLEHRAEDCVMALYEIESEIFGFSFSESGGIVPIHLEYWPKQDDKFLTVYLRCSY